MNIENLSPADLEKVQLDNIRVNQIGGDTDGITPGVAEDLGFAQNTNTLFKRAEHQDFDEKLTDRRKATATKAGKPTIAEAQKFASQAVAEHLRIRGDERKVNRSRK